ncbi:MAG: DUF4159 domain-containing protein [bacterium]
MNRRDFVKISTLAAAGSAVGTPFAGQEDSQEDDDRYDFLLPTVEFHCHNQRDDRWNYYPGAHRNLLLEFSSVVRCKIKEPTRCHNNSPRWGDEGNLNAVVTLEAIEPLRKYPFLFMSAEGPYSLKEEEKEILGEYLQSGGFLLMDDCIISPTGDYFYQSSCKIMEEIFGQGSVKRIPNSHEIFHNVYDLRDIGLPLGIGEGTNHGGQGVFIGDRVAVFLSSTDIHCGWLYPWNPWYKKSIEMGINIIMYSLSH